MSNNDSGLKNGWAILVTLPTGYKSHDYNVITEEDGVTPVVFETEAEARVTATGPKYGPLLARIDYPWRIAPVAEPFPGYWPLEPEGVAESTVSKESDVARGAATSHTRQTGDDPPLDLMEAHDRLRNMVAVLRSDLLSAGTSIPVILSLFHTSAPHLPSTVPTDIACALWAAGLPTVRDALDAALEPSRQLDAVSRLGLPPGFRPNVAVMVYKFWPVPEIFDGRLMKRKRQSYKPLGGVPRRLQDELRAHGCVPVVAEWLVLPWDDSVHLSPISQPHYARPGDNL